MQNLRDLTYVEMQALMENLEQPKFRGQQLFRWVHHKQAQDVEHMTDLHKGLREKLHNMACIEGISVDQEHLSQDGTRKFRLKTKDARLIESVLIPDTGARQNEEEGRGPRLTQCLSSQVGCAINCDFCATAKLGFGRNLTAGEIVSQVYLADSILAALSDKDPTRTAGGARLSNLVFMGMGEPLHNYEQLMKALAILTHPLGRNFPKRRITVSTAGLVPALEKFAKEPNRVPLAVSLNASHDEQRNRIMPINQKYNLEMLLGLLRRYPLEKKESITFEYVLLAGVNDSLADAKRLPALLKGIPCKINLIPWNPHPQSPYQKPDRETVLAFQAELIRHGFLVYIRKTKGDDIEAACGQLAANRDDRAGRNYRKLLPILSDKPIEQGSASYSITSPLV